MEQIRIVKEMRAKNGRTNDDIRFSNPRYMVWENVYGAFSSNKGEDFRVVLEEICKVVDPDAYVPGFEKGHKWTPCGVIMGDGYSVAWRSHDAQYWGVPQRRKRICVLADFNGHSAPRLLFDTELRRETDSCSEDEIIGHPGEKSRPEIQSVGESLSGNFEQGGKEREGAAAGVESSIGETSKCLCIENHPNDSRVKISEDGIVQTLSGRMRTGGGNTPMVMESSFWDGAQRMPDKDNFNAVITTSHSGFMINADDSDVAQTILATDHKDPQVIAYGIEPGLATRKGGHAYEEQTSTLRAEMGDNRMSVAYGIDRAAYNQGINALYDFSVEEEKIGTQVSRGPGAVCDTVVRRLTPLECERLQGFPDNWTDIGEWVDSSGKRHKNADSPRYKALGNSIAIPFWECLAGRITAEIDANNLTMGSLFDGIGGFPLAFSRYGVEPIWASEIEEFPIAVTKVRFKESDNNGDVN